MKNLSLLVVMLMAMLYANPVLSQIDSDIDTGTYGTFKPSTPKRHQTIIGFGPSSLWSPTIKFERGIGNWVSLGFHGRARFIFWNGGKVEPFVRVYFSEESPKGPYVQVKGSFGAYKRKFYFDNNCYYDLNGNYVCDDEDFFFSYGGGVAGGYQFFFGNKEHFALDVFGGFQYFYQNRSGYSDYQFLRRVFINFPVELGLRFGVAF